MADYRGKKMEKYLGASSTNSSSSSGGVRGGSSSLSAAEDMLWENAFLAGGEDGSISSAFRLPDIAHFSRPSSAAPYPGAHNFQPTVYYQGGADALPEPWELFANSPFEMTDHVSALDHLPFTGGFDHNPSYAPFGNRPHHVPMENHSRITNSASGGPPRNIGVIGDGRTRTRHASETHMANATREAPPRQVAQAANAYTPQMRVTAPSSGRPPRSPHVRAPTKSHDVGTARNDSRHLMQAPVANSPQVNRRPPSAHKCRPRSDCTTDWCFGLKPIPEDSTDWTPSSPVVPHARLVSMPAIGNVGAFMSTPESFLDFPAPGAPGGSASVIHRYLPARPQPVPRANPAKSSPNPRRSLAVNDAELKPNSPLPTNAAPRKGHH